MALYLDEARVRALGIGSPYASVAELCYGNEANPALQVIDSSRVMMTASEIWQAYPNVKAYQEEYGHGCSGWGIDFQIFYALKPALVWFIGLLLLRYVCREPLARLGLYFGVVTESEKHHAERLARGLRGTGALSKKNAQKLAKFQNQLWLSIFYVASTIFGYVVQRDKPWFTLPFNDLSSAHLLVPHPQSPAPELLLYYNYALGFYIGELFSIAFLEKNMKRSDFIEYVCHHFLTLALIVFSHLGWEHRPGAYVLFIHDASDIMLCVGKVVHYMVTGEVSRAQRYNTLHKRLGDGKKYQTCFLFRYVICEQLVNAMLVSFVAIFFYFRLWCLPMMGRAIYFISPKIRHGNFSFWLMAVELHILLQGLHLYWTKLIIQMAIGLVRGGERKDIRSDDEDDDEALEEADCLAWASRSVVLECQHRNARVVERGAQERVNGRVQSLSSTTEKIETLMHGNNIANNRS